MNASLVLGECKELEHFCWKGIGDDLSYKAIDSNGNCVGVFLSALSTNSELESEENENDDLIYQKHEKFYRIIQLTEELSRRVNLSERFPYLRDFVEGKVLSVDGKYRGQGVAGQLVERTFKEMERRRIPLMAIQCSSYYSARVMQKAGFELVAKIPYKDFHLNGKQAIVPASPHVEIAAFIKWVNYGQMGE